MNCAECGHWTTQRKTVYGDGSEIITYDAPTALRGHCEVLNLSTEADFGCTKFFIGDHVRITNKDGAPWHHFKMIPCPDCNQNPGGGQCRCAGTGLVRLYDDGYVGEEQTRRHPKENEAPAVVDPGTILQPVAKLYQMGADVPDDGGVL